MGGRQNSVTVLLFRIFLVSALVLLGLVSPAASKSACAAARTICVHSGSSTASAGSAESRPDSDASEDGSKTNPSSPSPPPSSSSSASTGCPNHNNNNTNNNISTISIDEAFRILADLSACPYLDPGDHGDSVVLFLLPGLHTLTEFHIVSGSVSSSTEAMSLLPLRNISVVGLGRREEVVVSCAESVGLAFINVERLSIRLINSLCVVLVVYCSCP